MTYVRRHLSAMIHVISPKKKKGRVQQIHKYFFLGFVPTIHISQVLLSKGTKPQKHFQRPNTPHKRHQEETVIQILEIKTFA